MADFVVQRSPFLDRVDDLPHATRGVITVGPTAVVVNAVVVNAAVVNAAGMNAADWSTGDADAAPPRGLSTDATG